MPTASEIFEQLPTLLKVDKAAGLTATVQFDLSGDDGGTWHVKIADGSCTTGEGAADSPTATIRMSADDYVAMTTGVLNPVNAFMMGKVKVEGDLNTVMKFQTLFAQPN